MAWFFIVIAGILEVVWAVGLRCSEGLTRPLISLGTVVTMIFSFVFLAQGLKAIPVGTGYAVWTGIGAVGTALVGMILLGESRDPLRVACLLLIIAGILGLKFVAPQ